MIPRAKIHGRFSHYLLCSTLLLTIQLVADRTWAEGHGCRGAAEAWISQLPGKNVDILKSHTQAKCEYSGKWMRENQQARESNSWKQMCTDLVLIWTYQECVYFRDDVETKAYTPCVEWTRRMYEECMANNLLWFEAAITR